MSFQIGSPEQRHKPGKDAFNIRPRNLASWIDGLPRANLGETARQIFSVLRETNGFQYRYQDRFHFLEAMREPVHYVTTSLKKHFVGSSLPLPEKSASVAAVSSQIFRSMAQAYQIAIEDMLNSHMLFTDKKMLALLIHRAITYHGLMMLTAYQTYAPCGQSCWAELNQLFQLAEKHKLLKYQIPDFLHSYVEKSSVKSEYLRLIMLSLCSPYRLRQGEVAKVHDTLERWVSDVELRHKDDRGAMENCLFGIYLGDDKPPSTLAFLHTEQADNDLLRIIDTRKLAKHLREEARDNQDIISTTLTGIDMSRPDISNDLMNRLLIAWGIGGKRLFPRIPTQDEVHILIGLTATHQFIGHRNHNSPAGLVFDDKYTHKAEFKSHNIKNDPNEQSRDVWNMIYPGNSDYGLQATLEKEFSLLEKQADGYAAAHPDSAPSALNWVVLNESATGYLMQCDLKEHNRIQVGELVGIRRNKNGKGWKWAIGAVRWMRYNKERSLQIGIEMLNPDAAAIGIRFVGNNQPYQRTLMLPELKNLKQPATLITGPVPWRVGNKVNINILGKEIRATLTKSMQNTGMFAQFQFELDDEVTRPPEGDEIPEIQDFAGIWASI